MATTKSMKIQAEIDKVKAKISEQQARLKELEQKKLEAENSEIVDIVRGMSISLTELPLLFEKLKDGGTLGCPEVRRRKEGGKLNMKHFRRMLAAGLCSPFFHGFAIPAYAYSDGRNENRLLWKKLRPRSQRLPLPRARLFGGWKPCDRSALRCRNQ